LTKTVICTTGTSIAGSGLLISDVMSAEEYRRAITTRIGELRKKYPDKAFLRHIAAETNSLQAMGIKSEDMVYLLHTPSGEGLICAELVAMLLDQELGVQAKLRGIEGLQVENAIISREAIIEEGVKIKNSVIMQNCVIEKDTIIVNAILDKYVRVTSGKVLVGTEKEPLMIRKDSVI